VGRTPGAKDVVNSGETKLTSFSIVGLPAGQTLHARLWTRLENGIWGYRDSSFSAGALAPQFVSPSSGSVGVDVSQTFEWTPPASAEAHWLLVGSSPGADDVVNSGQIGTTTYNAGELPSRRTLYARVWSKINGTWTRRSDIAFSTGAGRRAVMLAPMPDEEAFDAGQPFQWTPAPLSQGYRLIVGTAPGASDLHDSGEIHTTRRFVPDLPIGLPLFGEIQTKIDGEWRSRDFAFVAGGNVITPAARVESALWATDFVRTMAPADHRPFEWTPLAPSIAPRYKALCADYALLLLRTLNEINLNLPARRLDVSFNVTNFDVHTLVEMQDPVTGRWMILDPTFDLAAKNADGQWATAEDISHATRTSDWNAMSYVMLGVDGDSLARGYYLDYPMLFLNIHREGEARNADAGYPVVGYLTEVMLPVSEPSSQPYVIQCLDSATTVDVVLNGSVTTVACTGTEHTSAVFYGSQIAAVPASQSSFRVFQVPRFVF
jgi:hypothetical protein